MKPLVVEVARGIIPGRRVACCAADPARASQSPRLLHPSDLAVREPPRSLADPSASRPAHRTCGPILGSRRAPVSGMPGDDPHSSRRSSKSLPDHPMVPSCPGPFHTKHTFAARSPPLFGDQGAGSGPVLSCEPEDRSTATAPCDSRARMPGPFHQAADVWHPCNLRRRESRCYRISEKMACGRKPEITECARGNPTGLVSNQHTLATGIRVRVCRDGT